MKERYSEPNLIKRQVDRLVSTYPSNRVLHEGATAGSLMSHMERRLLDGRVLQLDRYHLGFNTLNQFANRWSDSTPNEGWKLTLVPPSRPSFRVDERGEVQPLEEPSVSYLGYRDDSGTPIVLYQDGDERSPIYDADESQLKDLVQYLTDLPNA